MKYFVDRSVKSNNSDIVHNLPKPPEYDEEQRKKVVIAKITGNRIVQQTTVKGTTEESKRGIHSFSTFSRRQISEWAQF